MINSIKTKNDEEYLKLFFRHSKNFLNLYIKDTPYCKIGRRLGIKLSANKSNNIDNKENNQENLNTPNDNNYNNNIKIFDNNIPTENPKQNFHHENQ